MKINRARSFFVGGIVTAVFAMFLALIFWQHGMFTSAVFLMACALALLIVSLYASRDRQPLIELADQGLILSRCNAVVIPWSEIAAVSIERLPKAGHFLIIKLKSEKYDLPAQCRQAMTRQRDHRTEIVLMVEGLSMPPGLIVQNINEHLEIPN